MESAKIGSLAPGSLYTLAFLGIRSGLDAAEKTRTAQALPGFCETFEFKGLDFSATGNASLLPNSNGIRHAFLGMANCRQAQMGAALAEVALRRGLRVQTVTHSNGVNGAAEAVRRLELGTEALERVVVIAPNTAAAAKVRILARAARRFAIVTSAADDRLKWAPFSHLSPMHWAAVVAEFAAACVVMTAQTEHGAQAYLREVLDGRAVWL